MIIDLLRHGAAFVSYTDGGSVAARHSPRPFLTATTSRGIPVTDVSPADHRHHLGMSATAPDVGGTSFWGGRTFVRDVGSTMLDNHGTQRVLERAQSGGVCTERVSWEDRAGDALLHEERTIATEASGDTVSITWISRLTAVRDDVTFGTPQTNGRPGAFYGGLFWRTPFPSASVRTADGEGIDTAHGSRSPWLAVDGPHASLVAVTSNDMPWFVRSEGYVGFGPSIAATERRLLPRGQTLELHLAVAVLDEVPADPGAIAGELMSATQAR